MSEPLAYYGKFPGETFTNICFYAKLDAEEDRKLIEYVKAHQHEPRFSNRAKRAEWLNKKRKDELEAKAHAEEMALQHDIAAIKEYKAKYEQAMRFYKETGEHDINEKLYKSMWNNAQERLASKKELRASLRAQRQFHSKQSRPTSQPKIRREMTCRECLQSWAKQGIRKFAQATKKAVVQASKKIGDKLFHAFFEVKQPRIDWKAEAARAEWLQKVAAEKEYQQRIRGEFKAMPDLSNPQNFGRVRTLH